MIEHTNAAVGRIPLLCDCTASPFCPVGSPQAQGLCAISTCPHDGILNDSTLHSKQCPSLLYFYSFPFIYKSLPVYFLTILPSRYLNVAPGRNQNNRV